MSEVLRGRVSRVASSCGSWSVGKRRIYSANSASSSRSIHGRFFARMPDPRCCSRETLLGGQIEEKYRFRPFETAFQSAGVVAVDDPAVLPQDRIEFDVEFLACGRRLIGLMPEHVEVDERQVERVAQLSCKRALPRARAANDEYALRGVRWEHGLSFDRFFE